MEHNRYVRHVLVLAVWISAIVVLAQQSVTSPAGMDIGSPVDFSYKMPFAYTGKIEKVTIDLK